MEFKDLDPPTSGTRIEREESGLMVPEDPVLPVIIGDGIGPEIWAATRPVLDAAVETAFGEQRRLEWFELPAGQSADETFRTVLPEETAQAIRYYRVALKGPLDATPGGATCNPNVSLRRQLDLFATVRPLRWFDSVPCPVKQPEKVDIVLFQESTEDLRADLQWGADSEEAGKLSQFLTEELGAELREGSSLGLKALSAQGSKRLIRRALQHAVDSGRSSLTLVHGGERLPAVEGAFRDWGYELAKSEFADSAITEEELWEKYEGDRPDNKVVIKDRSTESMFGQLLTRANDHSVLATTQINGAYLAAALTAQLGSQGLAPAAHIGDEAALFEAGHGTAPRHAGADSANPGSLMLSGAMMLEHLGWSEAARLVTSALQGTLQQQRVTRDLERQMSGATLLSCSEFGAAVLETLEAR